MVVETGVVAGPPGAAVVAAAVGAVVGATVAATVGAVVACACGIFCAASGAPGAGGVQATAVIIVKAIKPRVKTFIGRSIEFLL